MSKQPRASSGRGNRAKRTAGVGRRATTRKSPALRRPVRSGVVSLGEELRATQALLDQRTATLRSICDSAPWTGIRMLGALRRLGTGIGDDGVRERELNELAAALNHLLRPGVVFSYDDRGWNAIRLLGALRRMVAKGVLRGGWESERAELGSAARALLALR